MEKTGEIADRFIFLAKLGEGAYGRVYKAQNKATQEIVAIKQINKNRKDLPRKYIDAEKAIMEKVSHPNIVRLIEHLETSNSIYFILELCDMPFSTYLEDRKENPLSPTEGLTFLKQMINAFHELHKFEIIHRDLKPENFLIKNKVLKIADFGLAKQEEDKAKTVCGTPQYCAPEIRELKYKKLVRLDISNCSYDNKVDIFSLGVCFYEMLVGQLPWKVAAKGRPLTEDLITQLAQSFKTTGVLFPPKPVIPNECKALINAMMEYEPSKRIDWKELSMHPLFHHIVENPYRHAIKVFRLYFTTNLSLRELSKARDDSHKIHFAEAAAVLCILISSKCHFDSVDMLTNLEKGKNTYELLDFGSFLNSKDCQEMKDDLKKVVTDSKAGMKHFLKKYQEEWEMNNNQDLLEKLQNYDPETVKNSILNLTRKAFKSVRKAYPCLQHEPTSDRASHVFKTMVLLHNAANSDDILQYRSEGQYTFDWEKLRKDTKDKGYFATEFKEAAKQYKDKERIVDDFVWVSSDDEDLA